MKKAVIVIAILAAAVTLGVIGKQYYDNRYVGKDYYAMVPLDYDVAPEVIYSDKGEELGQGKEYALVVYNNKGEAKSVKWVIRTEDGGLPQRGSFLLVKASEQIVTGWSVIKEDQIPIEALKKIKSNNMPSDT
ncbi:MAG: YxeA family protein [Candidatus Nomurabacteria bacterium]|jgi:uncharacterized protein (TIGR01655 family)|nr:YxeA family protein [Candidatus Nomurabacteria bacterium]